MNSCKVAFALSIILLPTIFYCDKLLAQSPVAAETTDAMMPLSLIPRWNKESPWIVVDQNPKYPRRSNPYVGNEVAHQVYWATERHREVTDESGHFQIAVLPGKGHLMVKAPTDEYESQNVSRGELFCGEPKLDYYCMESLQAIDPMPGDEPLKITLALRVGAGSLALSWAATKNPSSKPCCYLLPTRLFGSIFLICVHGPCKPNGKFEAQSLQSQRGQQVDLGTVVARRE